MKLIAILTVLALAPAVHAASISDSDMPDEVRALLMKEKAKGTLKSTSNDKDENGGHKSGSGSKSGCNLDIGNVNSGRNAGGGTPRTVTTIVTGPVIQMNNKCN